MDRLKEYDQIEVFKFLDAESLKQCTEVNKEWATTISTNSQLMSKLPLKIKPNWESRTEELMNLQRVHNSIVIDELDGDEIQPLLEALSHILPHIKTADIAYSEIPMNDFKNFLSKTQNLEKLAISYGSISESPMPRSLYYSPPHLPSLKSLTLESTEWGCLSALKHTQITDLTIIFEEQEEEQSEDENNDIQYLEVPAEEADFFETVNTEPKVFKDFFESQKNLVTLTLQDFPILLIDCLSSYQTNYGLKKITLDIIEEDNTAEGFEKVIRFLKHHKSTLEYLKITKVNDALMVFIWTNLRLRELDVGTMTSGMNVPKTKFAPNHDLKKLRIETVPGSSTNFVVKTLRVYRSIQHLTIGKMCSKREHLVLKTICKFLTCVRYLKVPKLIAGPENCKPRVVPSLKRLEVTQLGALGPREKYFIDFKGIETVSIETILLRRLMNLILPDTKHLKVGVYNCLLQSEYLELSQHSPKLRFLEFLEVDNYFRQKPFRDGHFSIIQNAIGPSNCSKQESFDSIDSNLQQIRYDLAQRILCEQAMEEASRRQ